MVLRLIEFFRPLPKYTMNTRKLEKSPLRGIFIFGFVLFFYFQVGAAVNQTTGNPETRLYLLKDDWSLTLYVEGTEKVNLSGFSLSVDNDNEPHYLIDLFPILDFSNGIAEPGSCYLLTRGNLPNDWSASSRCKDDGKYFPRTSAESDVFWFHILRNELRDISIRNDSVGVNKICAAANPECEIVYVIPTSPPGMVEINPGSAVFIDQEVPLIKETWSGAHNHCQSRSAQNSDFDFTLPTYDHLKQAFDNNLIEIPPDDFEWILNRIESSPPGKFPYVTYNTVDDTAGIYPEAADSETRLTRRTSGRCVATLKS